MNNTVDPVAPSPVPGRPSYPTYSKAGAERFNIPRAVYPYIRRFWLIALLAILGGVSVGVLAYRLPDVYTARSILLVAKQGSRVLSIEGVGQPDRVDDLTMLNTVAQSISNSLVLRRVVVSERLTEESRLVSRSGTNVTEDEAVAQVRNMLSVRLRPKTFLIDIAVQSTNARMSALVANAVAREYLAERSAGAMKLSQTGSESLVDVVKRLETKLRDSERRMMEFREKNQISSVDSNLKLLEQLGSKIRTDLVLARKDLETAETNRKLVEDAKGRRAELLSISAIAKDPGVALSSQQIAQQHLILAGFTNRYRPQHPKFFAARQHLESLERSQQQEIEKAILTLDTSLPVLQSSEKSLMAELVKYEQRVQELNRLSAEYSALEREVATDTALQQSVLKRIKELDLTKDVDSVPVSVAEVAVEPTEPSGPARNTLIAVGVFMGLCFAVGIIYFLESSDNSLRTVDEAEDRLQHPVLGAVSIDTGSQNKAKARLVMEDEAHGLAAESFRTLRANTAMLGKPEAIKVRLVTSALAGEGKSFCAMNYAAALAQLGKSVVLVDMDLRRPTVGSRLDIPEETPGVSSYLLGHKKLDEIVQKTRVNGLSVIVAGPSIPNPAEQLAGPHTGELFAELTGRFDIVVVDTAPINAVADTIGLLDHAQVILLVIKAAKTPDRVSRRAISEIVRAGARVSGIILNQLPKGGGYGYYYSYYTKDGYSSSGVYGAPGKKKGR